MAYRPNGVTRHLLGVVCLAILACCVLDLRTIAQAQEFSAQEFPYLDTVPQNPERSELRIAWQRYELEHAAHIEATRRARDYRQRTKRVGLTLMVTGMPISFATAFLSLLEVSAGHGEINYQFVWGLLITSGVGLLMGVTGAGLLLYRHATNPYLQARVDARDRAREAKRDYEQIRRNRSANRRLSLAPMLRLQGQGAAVGLQLRLSM